MDKKEETAELERYCRQLAYVPYQDTPYHPALTESVNALNELGSRYLSSDSEEEIKRIRSGLESLASQATLRNRIRSFFSGEVERLESLGKDLLSKKEEIKSFKEALAGKYNSESRALYTISAGIGSLVRLREDFITEKEALQEELASFRRQSDEEKEKQLGELVEEKIGSEGKEYSYSTRQQIKRNLRELGRRHLSETAGEYLKLIHDIYLIENLAASYSPLIAHSEETSVLLGELVKYAQKQAAAVDGVLNAYLGITRKELFYTLQGSLPSGLVDKVNEMTAQIQEVDRQTGQKVLEKMFEERPRIRGLALDGVVPGVVKKLAEGEQ